MAKSLNELGAPAGYHQHPRIGEWPAAGLSREAAARFVGVSPTMFDRLVREGIMPRPIPLRRRRIWFIEALTDRLRQLSGLPGETATSAAIGTGKADIGSDAWMTRIRRIGNASSS